MGVEVFLGFGAETAKSVEFVCVSVQPSAFRNAAVVLDGAGADAPRKQFAEPPYPTKSMMLELFGHVPLSAVVEFMSATFPAVAAKFMVPLTSGVGSAAPVVPPELS